MSTEYPNTDLRKLAGVYEDYSYQKILKINKEYKIEYIEHSLMYMKEEKKICIDSCSTFKPKNSQESVSYLYFEIKKISVQVYSKYLEFKTFKFNGVATRGYYNLYDSFLEQKLTLVSSKLNNSIYNSKNIDYDNIKNKMLSMYDVLYNLESIFNISVSDQFDYKFTNIINLNIRFITYNPYWTTKDNEYDKIIKPGFEIEEDADDTIYIKSEEAEILEL
jgi:hypothetical protein